ncbi:MAG TPA: copper homeostasis protein CutC [Luteitalea sp.]|nr:copper homeostasis protein CutC [Luteitalea sp.]
MSGQGGDRALEVIVMSVDDAVRAEEGGATRVEVVRDIHQDGLTPDRSLVEGLLARVRIPLRVMVRPRNTFLVGDPAHRDEIRRDAERFADLPVDVVTGYVRAAADGTSELDEEALALVTERVPRARITVHRAVERLTADPSAALHRCAAVDRVLSGGGAGSWQERMARLVDLQARIAPVRVIVGGGVTDEGVALLAEQPSLTELHVGRLARVDASFTQTVDVATVARLRRAWFGEAAQES